MTDTRIMLAGGTLFDLLDPAGSTFTLQDIAHGLGRVCRFAGHTNRFYSVAEHCVHVARLVPLRLARAALLHDGAEAFIGDVTRPLKALLPEYRLIEERIDKEIQQRFLSEELASGSRGTADHAIKAADTAMCLVEARYLMPNVPGYWNLPVDPAMLALANEERLNCEDPARATTLWLRAWHHYSHRIEALHTQLAASRTAGEAVAA